MSQSPADESNRSDAEKYGTAWAAIMQLVRDGKSWSGREKNCCYLNTASSLDGATRFANISHVSGLDFADDSRAIAVVDWDHDGDLDLWFRNRTAPRLRFMANQLDARRRSYVALRLEGTSSNRDGVGAVVEVVPRRSRAPRGPPAPRRRRDEGLPDPGRLDLPPRQAADARLVLRGVRLVEGERKEFATFALKHAQSLANDVRLLKKQRIDPGG